jgi:hypothetical protein
MNSRCDSCGIPVDELAKFRHRVELLEGELALAEKDLRVKRAAISRLTGERNGQRQLSPFADQAREWFDHWNLVCRSNKAKEFGADRFDPTVDRIAAGHTFEEWRVACEGARRLLHDLVPHKLRSVKSFTEMATMVRDEKSLMGFIDTGERELAPDNVVQLRPAPDHSGIPTLSVWVEGRILGDCPHCGQAGRVVPKRDGLGLFECFGRCAEGSGVYRLAGHEVAALRERTA